MVTRIKLSLKKAAGVVEANWLLSETTTALSFAKEAASLAAVPPARCSPVSGSAQAEVLECMDTAVDPVKNPGLTGL